jgi:hypothetical protein
MEEILLEAAKQVPNLVVLALIVWRFLRTIAEQGSRFEAAATRFAEVAERSAEVIGANTETLRRLNGGTLREYAEQPHSPAVAG